VSLHQRFSPLPNRGSPANARYVNQKKAKRGVDREVAKYQAEQKAVREEMEQFVRFHEDEINKLLEEYWKMRTQAGTSRASIWLSELTGRGVHERDYRQAGPSA
jgi:hypothetical protein